MPKNMFFRKNMVSFEVREMEFNSVSFALKK